MNVRRKLIPVTLMVGMLGILALGSCGREQTTAPSAGADAAASPQPIQRSAYAVVVTGSAQLHGPSSPVEIDPGALIASGRRVTVATDSHLDVQFGDRGVTRIYGPAEAIVRTQIGPGNHPVMEVDVVFGSVAAKVQPLRDDEVYRVRTPLANYIVQGTRFHIDVDAGDLLTVDEGVVAVHPRSVDTLLLRRSIGDGETQLHQLLDEFERTAPSFGAGTNSAANPAVVERAEALAGGLSEIVNRLAGATAAQRPSLVEDLIEVIRATTGALAGLALPTADPPPSTQERLASIAAVRLVPVPAGPQGVSLLESESAAQLVTFTLRTLPQNAQIYLDGAYVGSSVYRGILRANQSLSIRVAKAGYRERRIEVDRARTEVITVQLERLPPSIGTDSFLKAVVADDIGTVRTYVAEGGSVNVRSTDGTPALILASGLMSVLLGRAPDLSYDREILRTLVAAGADLEVEFLIEGSVFRPLHAAVLAGVAGFDVNELLDIFLSGRVSANSVIVLEGQSLTPLAIAVRWALFTGETQEEIIRRLMQAGAGLDVTISFNDELLTLREIASRLIRQGEIEDQELIRLLRRAGAGT